MLSADISELGAFLQFYFRNLSQTFLFFNVKKKKKSRVYSIGNRNTS